MHVPVEHGKKVEPASFAVSPSVLNVAHSPRDDPLGDHSLLVIDHEPGVARVSDDLIEALEKGFSV